MSSSNIFNKQTTNIFLFKKQD